MGKRRRSAISDEPGSNAIVERLTPTGRKIALIHSNPASAPSLMDSAVSLDPINASLPSDIYALWQLLEQQYGQTINLWHENEPMHKDPVTPQLRHEILKRDGGCIAPMLDLTQLGTCSGRLTLDHVKDQARMGKRAPSDANHLVTLCEWHHQGQKAGSVWATTKEHRDWLRMYLEWVNDVPM